MTGKETAEQIARDAVATHLRDVTRNHAATAHSLTELLGHASADGAFTTALEISGQREAGGEATAAARTIKTAVREELGRRIAGAHARWAAR